MSVTIGCPGFTISPARAAATRRRWRSARESRVGSRTSAFVVARSRPLALRGEQRARALLHRNPSGRLQSDGVRAD
jgi:hypothetical protein